MKLSLFTSSIRKTLQLMGILGVFFSQAALAQDIPTVFTDKIFKGSGSIDMLLDVSASELDSYFTSEGRLILGVDVNEANSGVETSSSLGVAIKQIELLITTTDGDFSFSDFYTNTTANIIEAGTSTASEYYTLFGTGGSNTLNSGTGDFSQTLLDDVIYLDNIAYTGEVLGVRLNVSFLKTSTTLGGVNESFFDYSGGFEDFAIIYEQQSLLIEQAASGIASASSELTFTTATVTSPTVPIAPTAPGAPLPPLEVLAGLGLLFALRVVQHGRIRKT